MFFKSMTLNFELKVCVLPGILDLTYPCLIIKHPVRTEDHLPGCGGVPLASLGRRRVAYSRNGLLHIQWIF